MADRYWLGTTDAVYSTAANWAATSGGAPSGVKPGAGDDVFFDGAPDNPCTIDEATAAINSLAVHGAGDPGGVYTATLDFNNQNVNATGGGDMNFRGTGAILCGDGNTITCSGLLHNIFQTGGGWDPETSTFVLDGEPGAIVGHSSRDFYNLTISGTVELRATTSTLIDVNNILEVSGEFTLSDTCRVNGDLQVTGTGSIVGNSGLLIINSLASITVMDGVISVAEMQIRGTHIDNIVATEYNSADVIFSHNLDATFQPSAGTYTFTGHVLFESTGGTYLIDNAIVGASWVFEGDVTIFNNGGTVNWSSSEFSSITLSGSNDQDIDFNLQDIESLIIDKDAVANKVTFTGGWRAESFTATKGTIDFNGQSCGTIGGDFIMGTDSRIVSDVDAMNGVALTAGNDLILSGVDGTPLVVNFTAVWTLLVSGNSTLDWVNFATTNTDAMLFNSGTPVASNCEFAWCDASSGTQVNAKDNCVNNGNNTNVLFQAALNQHHHQQQQMAA